MMLNVVKSASPSKLVDSVCVALGYGHNPYTWIENYCEEMIEEHSGIHSKLNIFELFFPLYIYLFYS